MKILLCFLIVTQGIILGKRVPRYYENEVVHCGHANCTADRKNITDDVIHTRLDSFQYDMNPQDLLARRPKRGLYLVENPPRFQMVRPPPPPPLPQRFILGRPPYIIQRPFLGQAVYSPYVNNQRQPPKTIVIQSPGTNGSGPSNMTINVFKKRRALDASSSTGGPAEHPRQLLNVIALEITVTMLYTVMQ